MNIEKKRERAAFKYIGAIGVLMVVIIHREKEKICLNIYEGGTTFGSTSVQKARARFHLKLGLTRNPASRH